MRGKMMHNIFKQIAPPTEVDESKNHVRVTFGDLEYKFLVTRGTIIIEHISHAVVAAIVAKNGKVIKHKTSRIEASSTVFEWLGIKYTHEFITANEATVSMPGDVISFF